MNKNRKKMKTGISLRHRKLVCENDVFYIYFDHIEGKNNFSVKNYLVVAPKARTKKKMTGVSVLPIKNNKLGLIHIYRHPVKSFSWEIPRGFVDAGETSRTAAQRELHEELGLSTLKRNLKSLGAVMPEPGIINARVEIYLAQSCSSVKNFKIDEVGHQKIKFFTPQEIQKMITQSKIQDPCTLIAYYRYRELC